MRSQKGFTLIEVIIVIGIFSFLMVALLNLFEWHNKVYFQERAEVQTTDGTRQAFNSMTKYIAQASHILSSITFGSTNYTTDNHTLVLQLPAFDSNGNIISNGSDYVIYYLANNSLYQLIQTNGSSARHAGTKLLSENVSSLSFTYNNASPAAADTVTVDLQTQASVRNVSTVTSHLNDVIFLRNQ